MCGVVGYVPIEPTQETDAAFRRLVLESRVRGLHACGLAQPGRAAARAFTAGPVLAEFDRTAKAIAHTRYCTSGDWRTIDNNQPVVVGAFALAFNGVIHMGTKAEFEAAFHVACVSDNDGEVFVRRVLDGESAEAFLARLRGSFAGVWLDGTRLYAARNERRPLWHTYGYGGEWYASTRDVFERAGFQDATVVRPLAVCAHV